MYEKREQFLYDRLFECGCMEWANHGELNETQRAKINRIHRLWDLHLHLKNGTNHKLFI